MSNVITGTKAKVKARVPDQIGLNARWTEAFIESLIIAADRATRDLCEIQRQESVLSLSNDELSYDVPSFFISIDKVEFSLDGTNYDWLLQSRGMTDLDAISHSWRNDRSTRPDFYTLLSAPGVQKDSGSDSPSKILLYPTLEAAGSAKIRLTGVAVPPLNLNTYNSVVIPDDVQSKCLVPYVMSVLYATSSPELSLQEYKKFKSGCEALRNRFRSQMKNAPSRRGGSE